MISMELQRDVPQYMAIPWLMTWVMARTVSVRREGGAAGWGAAGGPGLGGGHSANAGAGSRAGCCKDVLQALYFLAPRSGCGEPGRQKTVDLLQAIGFFKKSSPEDIFPVDF